MIGFGCRSFGSSACFCLSFLLEGMETGCLSHPGYPQSKRCSLPAQLDVPLPCGWGQAAVLGKDLSRVGREGQHHCTADLHVFTSAPFPMPFVQGHRFTGRRREEEGADLYHHPAPPKVFRGLPRPPQTQ